VPAKLSLVAHHDRQLSRDDVRTDDTIIARAGRARFVRRVGSVGHRRSCSTTCWTSAFVGIESVAVTSTVCPTGEGMLPNDDAALICTASLSAPNVAQNRPGRSGGRRGYPMPR
jgi:hypothetical protein